ncbi:hypothetical protein ACHAO7_011884 [Fusarium culmorum]
MPAGAAADVETTPTTAGLLEKAPRITSELPGVDLSAEERHAAVARARARILEIVPADQNNTFNEGITSRITIKHDS